MEYDESRKRPREDAQLPGSGNKRRRVWIPYSSVPRAPHQQGQTGNAPRPSVSSAASYPRGPTNVTGPRPPVTCFNCGEPGHISRGCPMKTGYSSQPTPEHAVGRGVPLVKKPAKPSIVGRGHLNHVTIEEAQEDPSVLLGTLRINSVPATVLFDSGASHSFISQVFAEAHGIEFVGLTPPLVIRSPGHSYRTSMVSHGVLITIRSFQFPSSLIALKSDDIDVILGMDWLSKFQAVIDCAARSVTVTHPSGDTVKYWSASSVPPSSTFLLEAELCAEEVLPALEIHDVPVVRNFPDVFPEELPGMPPDRVVEFVIDLVPGTALISKRPYRMAPEELVELKKQIEELELKKYIEPSTSPGDVLSYLSRSGTPLFHVWLLTIGR